MGWIYKLTSPSGKAYIGKTVTRRLEDRLNAHRRASNKCHAIANAIKKYGFENFVVEKWEFPDEYLLEYEQLFILDHGTLSPDGYNLKAAGYDCTYTEEVRRRMSEKALERWQDDDFRARVVASFKEDRARPERREAVKAAWNRPGMREKQSEMKRANWQDEDFRAKQSLAKEGRWTDAERQKASEAAKLRWETRPELKKQAAVNQSALSKKRWQDPEFREKMRAAMTGRKMSDEARAIVSQKRKAEWAALSDEEKKRRIAARAAGHARAKEARQSKRSKQS